MTDDSRYDESVRFLTSRINFEQAAVMPYRSRRWKLRRMADLLKRLGNPQRRLRIVHIAGTKGKGSTACTLSALLRATGARVGLFTSPHIERLEERFLVDDAVCSGEELCELVDRVREPIAAMDARGERPTFFEIVNAIAYLHFVARQVDWTVLEVGLGGRLDSSNICRPELAVITSISFDHTRQLGNTLAKIAREKAGIIKRGCPVVSGVVQSEPRDVIHEIARQRRAPLVELGRDFDVRYRPTASEPPLSPAGPVATNTTWTGGTHGELLPARIDFFPLGGLPFVPRIDLPLRLPGRHQAANAALALAVLDLLFPGGELSDDLVRRGLEQVVCPARIELLGTAPLVVVDTAHNVASAAALAEVLGQLPRRGDRHLFLTGTQGKDLAGMLRHLLPRFDRVMISRYSANPRGMDVQRLYHLATEVLRTDCVCDEAGSAGSRWRREDGRTLELLWQGDAEGAWPLFCQPVTPADLVCITGSFFFVAEARRRVEAAGWSNLAPPQPVYLPVADGRSAVDVAAAAAAVGRR